MQFHQHASLTGYHEGVSSQSNLSPSPDSNGVDSTFPTTWTQHGLSAEQYAVLMQHSLSALARAGASPSQDILDDLAQEARISPSHHLIEDSQALYEECLRFALSQLWPADDVADLDDLPTTIPADAIRNVVASAFRSVQQHPTALRFLVAENLFNEAQLAQRRVVLEDSPVMLQLDRVLMRGHDVGAFRAGVSAEDVYILILSLCSFPVTSGSTFHALYGMNVTESSNSTGLEALIADAAIAFLTTPMPTSQGSSYTHSSLSMGVGSSVAATLYSSEQAPTTDSSGGRDSASPSRGAVSSSSDANPAFPDSDLYQHE